MLLKICAVKELDNISIYFRDKDFFSERESFVYIHMLRVKSLKRRY